MSAWTHSQHYVEYLVGVVAKSKIDPLPILDLTDCVQELRRRGIPLPERGPWDTDEIYKGMCAEVRTLHASLVAVPLAGVEKCPIRGRGACNGR